MEIQLAYGKTGRKVRLPEERTVVIEPSFVKGLVDEDEALLRAIREPVNSPPLRSLVARGNRVAIAICDVTRPMPSDRVLPVILRELDYVPRENIQLLVATGTHRETTRSELRAMLGAGVADRYPVINHVSTDTNGLKDLGVNKLGIPVLLNRLWVESDVRITTGFVEPHFFAGFSGGPKLVAPGLAGLETVLELHSARLIADRRSTWGIIDDNPIHSAIRQIAADTGVTFALDVTINSEHKITGVYAGELFTEHRLATEAARRSAMQAVSSPFDIVVTTNSGYPLDLNLYQSVKGMSAAARIVKRGGLIICAAECSDGVPDHGAYGRILAESSGPSEILEKINCPGFSMPDQWQAQIQAQIQAWARVQVKCDGLSAEQLRSAHLEPCENIEDSVARELAARGPGATVCVLPQGPQTIPYLGANS